MRICGCTLPPSCCRNCPNDSGYYYPEPVIPSIQELWDAQRDFIEKHKHEILKDIAKQYEEKLKRDKEQGKG